MDDKRLSNGSANSGVGQDIPSSSAWPQPSGSGSPPRESLDSRTPEYRQHVRQESLARERAQHDALMDYYTPASTVQYPAAATASGQPDHPANVPSQEASQQPRGFGKILKKMGLKK